MGQKTLALEDINLAIPTGSFTAIVGPNNSGKSTLGQIISGLLTPSSGQVLIEGLNLVHWDHKLLTRTIGLIFSNPEDQIIFPTVEEDLTFSLESLPIDAFQIEKEVADILEFLEMKDYRQFPIHHLSGGQKQKIALAAMIIRGLRYLVVDEPISYLDAQGKREVLTLIHRLHQAGTTIIYLAQGFEELTIAERIVALSAGRVIWQGSFVELLQRPDDAAQWGIEVPPVVRLVKVLQEEGIAIAHPVYTVDQLLQALKKIKNES
ncbi:MAG: ATP-binding cassette domain-containing protein [bacterium]